LWRRDSQSTEQRKTSTNALLASFTYTWNAQGLRGREDSIHTTTSYGCRADYSYHGLGRLTPDGAHLQPRRGATRASRSGPGPTTRSKRC
jgi:hypothetical protein